MELQLVKVLSKFCIHFDLLVLIFTVKICSNCPKVVCVLFHILFPYLLFNFGVFLQQNYEIEAFFNRWHSSIINFDSDGLNVIAIGHGYVFLELSFRLNIESYLWVICKLHLDSCDDSVINSFLLLNKYHHTIIYYFNITYYLANQILREIVWRM